MSRATGWDRVRVVDDGATLDSLAIPDGQRTRILVGGLDSG
jgi:hypothetical protein